MWLIRPSTHALTLDFSYESKDLEKFVSWLYNKIKDGEFETIAEGVSGEMRERDPDWNDEDIEEESKEILMNSYSPKSIVSSAESYDDPESLEALYQYTKYKVDFVLTPDGAVVMDSTRGNIEAVRVPRDEEELEELRMSD